MFPIRKTLAEMFLLLSVCVSVVDLRAQALTDHHLTIPVNPFPPWVAEHEGNVVGIDAEIIALLAEQLGFSYDLVTCPFARCLKLMEQGAGDFMIGLFRTPLRESYLKFIEHGYLEAEPKAFYVKEQANVHIDHYDDLRNLRIGVVRGTSYFPRFDNDHALSKVESSSDRLLVDMLLRERFEAFIGTPSHVEHLMSTEAITGIREARFKQGDGARSYAAVSRSSPLMQHFEAFEIALRSLIDSGKLERVATKYR